MSNKTASQQERKIKMVSGPSLFYFRKFVAKLSEEKGRQLRVLTINPVSLKWFFQENWNHQMHPPPENLVAGNSKITPQQDSREQRVHPVVYLQIIWQCMFVPSSVNHSNHLLGIQCTDDSKEHWFSTGSLLLTGDQATMVSGIGQSKLFWQEIAG